MSADRLNELLDSYGADPANWPEEDRGLAHLLRLPQGARETSAFREAQRTDKLLERLQAEDREQRDMARTVGNIMAATAPQRTRQGKPPGASLVDWLFPEAALARLLRPALAASLPLLVGVAVGLAAPFETYDAGYEPSVDQELRWIAITEDSLEEWSL